MSPKKSRIVLAILTGAALLLLSGAGWGGNPMKGPESSGTPLPLPAARGMGEGFVIMAYQKVLSPVGGARCRMHPSCSRYARESLNTFGLLKGYIMTCDRLLRCNRDELRVSPVMWVGGRKKCVDLVSANDVWPSSD